VILAVVVALAGTAVVLATADVGTPPRSLAGYVERRAAGHGGVVAAVARGVAGALNRLDRGSARAVAPAALGIGAHEDAAAPLAVSTSERIVDVASADALRDAIAAAQPGDVITLAPGVYRTGVADIVADRPGRPDAGITVRAPRLGAATIEQTSEEGFVVTAPYWRFENLAIRGVCARHGDCEHAFHVVGAASHFLARNNVLLDFNAHVKVNGSGGHFPDHGALVGNTLRNTEARRTDKPVAPIDIVGASHWSVRGNLISDFVKAGGDGISTGAFAKGAGSATSFEGNAVLCELRLRGQPGSRVGLALGGGGTAPQFCRDGVCVTEQDGGVIASNLIAFCSDDGIYLNRAAATRIVHNTLLDTGGIVVRFAQSSADVTGNLVDGAIRVRDGGLVHGDDNLSTAARWLYLGRHPQRTRFVDASALELAWAAEPPRTGARGAPAVDLCGATRPARPAYGAFEDIRACRTARALGDTAR
jgi:hypothetical protein